MIRFSFSNKLHCTIGVQCFIKKVSLANFRGRDSFFIYNPMVPYAISCIVRRINTNKHVGYNTSNMVNKWPLDYVKLFILYEIRVHRQFVVELEYHWNDYNKLLLKHLQLLSTSRFTFTEIFNWTQSRGLRCKPTDSNRSYS